MIATCETRQDFDRLVQNSEERPVFLLKHSTRCPISRSAWRAFQQFDASHPEAGLWKVLVIENAALSSEIAREVGVRHQSPQVLLFHRGEVVWNDSHWSIKLDALQDALDRTLAD
jgi:bacillithiol system protein YtxJ